MDVTYYVALSFVAADDGVAAGEVPCLTIFAIVISGDKRFGRATGGGRAFATAREAREEAVVTGEEMVAFVKRRPILSDRWRSAPATMLPPQNRIFAF